MKIMNNEENIILNTKEVANLLNCSISTIRRLIYNKQIDYFQINGKYYFNKKKVLENGRK